MILKKKAPYFLHPPRPLHLQSLKSQLHVVQCMILSRPLALPLSQASRPCTPSLRWTISQTSLRCFPLSPPSGPDCGCLVGRPRSQGPPRTCSFFACFSRKHATDYTLPRIRSPIPEDGQLNDLFDGEAILIPFLCSSLNALASITKQLDTITTQLATIQSIVATLPITPALDAKLSPINASIYDLSHRVSSAPPIPSAPPRLVVPPTSVGTYPVAPPPAPKSHSLPPKCNNKSAGFAPDISRYDPVLCVLYKNPRAYAGKFPDSWEANAFRDGKFADPFSFVSGHLDPNCHHQQKGGLR